jgi:ABC-2 type transport system ATP-binding protein
MQTAAIEIHHLCKTYRAGKTPAVDHLTLTVPKGAVFGLLGPNGAGKTTVIHILCGLRSFDNGEIFIAGYELKRQWKDIRRRIGFVPQDIALYPSLTACENLRVFGGLMGLRGISLENRINELLHLFGLEYGKHRRIEHYSGGMKRRVNLMAGLLHRPEILFLDEPTAGVDVQTKNLMLDNLKTVSREGHTIIYTSHYMEEAETLCTQIALIDKGKMICTGTPSELIAQTTGCGKLEDVYLQLTGKKLRKE